MGDAIRLEVDGRPVRVSSPDKPYFPGPGLTKLDLIDYYRSVADELMAHCRHRPLNMERYPQGVGGHWFMQKRVPASRPDWLATTVVRFSSDREAEELCPDSIADVLWSVNLGCISVHPWNVTAHHPRHPDELRVDLDPMPDVDFRAVREATLVVKEILDEHGVGGFAKTSGSTGMHVICPIGREAHVDVRRAAVVVAREAARRAPELVTCSWWREERGRRVFVDYNQNLWDRTMACAYAVRPVADARVSAPLRWDEVAEVDPAAFTVPTMADRLADVGDLTAGARDEPASLEPLLAAATAAEEAGVPDLPLPPHYPKFPNEPRRVAPSRAADRDEHG